VLKKGDHFGEKSLLLECPRTLDVIAKTQCIIYSISIETLKSLFGDKYKDVLLLNFVKMSFALSSNFNKINMKLLEASYDSFTNKDFKSKDIVIPAGYIPDSKIVVIVEGSLLDPKTNKIIAKRGDILFEDEIINNTATKIKNDYIAHPDCMIMEAQTEIFMKQVGGSFKEVFNKSRALESLERVPLFKNFPQKKKELLTSMIRIETYENGRKIIVQGETDLKFYIIKTGKVDIFIDSNYIRTLNELEFFGERALFFNEPRTATAQANGKVELYVLEEKNFKAILEDNLSSYLKNRFFLQDNSLEIKDLDYLRDLGSGSFGAVCLVRARKNRHMYAIKAMQKTQIDAEQLHKNIELERSILLQIDHPFIVKLVKTMKDAKNIFFLMEYIKGKELFDTIRDIGLLNKTQTHFYGGSLMLAIDYLHDRKFVYRDIKPENIMINESVTYYKIRVLLNLSISVQLNI
jgi:cGMP-dependent protein kinase